MAALVPADAQGEIGVGGTDLGTHIAGFAQDTVEGVAVQAEGDGGRAQIETLPVVAGAGFGIDVASLATLMPVAQIGRGVSEAG